MFTFKNTFTTFLLIFVSHSILLAQISITLDNANMNAVSCAFGIPCDGQITALASGGNNNNYTFEWSSGEIFSDVTSSTAVALCQGTQSVTVTDGSSEEIAFFEIGAPEPLSFDISSTTINFPSCFGDSDGGASIGAMGGTPGYFYQWDDPAATTGPTLTNVPSGGYSATITDANGCMNAITVIILQPDPLVILVDSIDDNGYLAVSTTGGVQGNINYDWTPDVSNDSIATDLPSGEYTIVATDQNGCTTDTTVIVDSFIESKTTEFNNDFTFRLFPNPTQHFFNIETNVPSERITQIALHNNLGQVVFLKNASAILNQKLDIQHLVPGAYYVEIAIDDGTSIIRKIIVE